MKKVTVHTVTKDDLLALFVGYNLNPTGNILHTAKARSGERFERNKLYSPNGHMIAQFVKSKRGKELLLVLRRQPWAGVGWNGTVYLRSALFQFRHPRIVQIELEQANVSYKALHSAFWKNTNEIALLHAAKLLGYSMKRFKTPPSNIFLKYKTPALFREPDVKAEAITREFTPEARLARRLAAKEAAFQDTVRRRAYVLMANTNAHINNVKHELAEYTALSSDRVSEAIEYIIRQSGHVPQPGDLYKRVRHINGQVQSKHGGFVWPPIGQWTTPVDGQVKACQNGYHVCEMKYLGSWHEWGDHLYLVEVDGDRDRDGSKTACRSVRLTKYIGEISYVKLREALDTPTSRARVAELESKLVSLNEKIAMTVAGYDCCLATSEPEQHYVRFHLGANLGGDEPFGAHLYRKG